MWVESKVGVDFQGNMNTLINIFTSEIYCLLS